MLSAIGEIVRRHDPDRFITALFAPPEKREALFLLYAFNHELARAREVASQPTLALIRLQWWREVVEGEAKRHELATPLLGAIEAGTLDRAALLTMIEGREVEAEAVIPTRAEWHDYLRRTAGVLMGEAGRALGAPEAMLARLATLGTAYGAAGVLRSVTALARHERCLLPADALAASGLVPEAVTSDPESEQAAAVRRALAEEIHPLLRQAKGLTLPRGALAAVLPAVLARRDLDRLRRGRPIPPVRGLGDRVAVFRAAVTRHLGLS
jgi:15-cis-phytoene synthase